MQKEKGKKERNCLSIRATFSGKGETASGSKPLSRTYCYSLVTILRYIRPSSLFSLQATFARSQSVKERRNDRLKGRGRWWGSNEAPVKSRRNVAASFWIEIARLPSFNEPMALYVGWLRCNSEYLRWMRREMKFTLCRIIPGWSRRSLQTTRSNDHPTWYSSFLLSTNYKRWKRFSFLFFYHRCRALSLLLRFSRFVYESLRIFWFFVKLNYRRFELFQSLRSIFRVERIWFFFFWNFARAFSHLLTSREKKTWLSRM